MKNQEMPQENKSKMIVQQTFAFDDEIVRELKKKFEGSDYEKTGILDQRISQLFVLYSDWMRCMKQFYSAQRIAKKLFIFDRKLRKT